MQETTQTVSLKDKFPWLTDRATGDFPAYNCPPEHIVELMRALSAGLGYDMLADLTAFDKGVEAKPRYTCIYHLYSLDRHEYLRIASDCLSAVEPSMPSLTSIWGGADWLEREVYDMFGITFSGHPDMRRILMWDNYPFHPLRKDFPLAGIPAPLSSEDPGVAAEIQGGKTIPAALAGGPFTAGCGTVSSKIEPRAKDQSWSDKHPKP
jgi:NADH-quinone oxidoreductase subunit C